MQHKFVTTLLFSQWMMWIIPNEWCESFIFPNEYACLCIHYIFVWNLHLCVCGLAREVKPEGFFSNFPILQAMLILNPKCRANVLHSVFANLILKFKLKKRRMMIEITSSFVLLCHYLTSTLLKIEQSSRCGCFMSCAGTFSSQEFCSHCFHRNIWCTCVCFLLKHGDLVSFAFWTLW